MKWMYAWWSNRSATEPTCTARAEGNAAASSAVMTVSVIMYKRLGLSNTDIALYTSWLYLPWIIKPVWSPLIDKFGISNE